MTVQFFVHMKPITQGSVSAFPIKRKNGSYGAVVTHGHSNELYSLRSAIEDEYHKANGTLYEKDTVVIDMTFSFIRPKSVTARKRPDMTVKPDIDKLCRTVLDALTGVAYRDDSQVVSIVASKVYAETEGIEIILGGVNRE